MPVFRARRVLRFSERDFGMEGIEVEMRIWLALESLTSKSTLANTNVRELVYIVSLQSALGSVLYQLV